jgi:hypothetical protein
MTQLLTHVIIGGYSQRPEVVPYGLEDIMSDERPAIEAEAEAEQQRLDFIGMDQVVALSSDAFLVAKGEDVFTILFFQNQIPPIKKGLLGQAGKLDSQETKCIARVTLSPIGFNKLLASMAGTVGAQLVPNEKNK